MDSRPLDALLGECPDGTVCTALEGFDLGGNTVYARSLMIGHHFERPENSRFRSVELRLSHLEQWTEHSPFAFPIKPLSEGEPQGPCSLGLPYQKKRLIQAEIPTRACRLEIWSGIEPSWHVYRSLNINHASFVFVEPTAPQAFAWFRTFLLELARLFSFLMGSRVCLTKTVLLCEEGADCSVELYGPTSSAVTAQDADPMRMPLSYSRFQSAAPTVFSNWFCTASEMAPVYQLLCETLPPCDMGLESVLLRLAQALEVFYRRCVKKTYAHANEYDVYLRHMTTHLPEKMPQALKDRLRNQLKYGNEYSLRNVVTQLIESLDPPAREALHIKRPSGIAGLTANTRNSLIHLSDVDGPVASGAREYHSTNQRLRALLYGVLAKSLGFGVPAVAHCVGIARACLQRA